MKKKRKPPSKAKHLKKLEKVFNKFIRLRDCVDGWGNCISCGENFPFERLHAGHYHHSKTSVLRFNELNVNIQCIGCNTYKNGNLIGYRETLVLRHGEEAVKEIESIRHQQLKMSRQEIDEQIEYYKNLLQTL